MNAQTYVDSLTLSEFRDWFQQEVNKLHGSTGPLEKAMGKRFRYAVRVCELEDLLPGVTSEQLKEIGESVLGLHAGVEEPWTYKQAVRLLRRCLRYERSKALAAKQA